MKIGILTFHYGVNYGGVLQCYALQEVLKEKGHQVSVIDFKATERRSRTRQLFDRTVSISSISDIKQIVLAFHKRRSDVIQPSSMSASELSDFEKKFVDFRNKYLDLTKSVDENAIAEVADLFDCIIIGSDQVWADIHERVPVYLGGWMPAFKGKLIAYAVCSPLSKIERPYLRRTEKLLNRFCGISTRDTHTKKIIPDRFKLPAKVVADPTMLFNNWNLKSPIVSGPYVLLYILRKEIDGGLDSALDKIKCKFPNRKTVAVISPESSVNRKCKYIDEFVMPTPLEWVSLVANADFLFTDSYHGCVFATKFKVPFIAYYDIANGGKYRLLELASQIGLVDCFVSKSDSIVDVPVQNGAKLISSFSNDSLIWLCKLLS